MDQATARELLASRDSHGITIEEDPRGVDSPDLSETAKAQEFLWSAASAVESLYGTAFMSRDLARAADGKSLNGVMGRREQELLRAALVFASAGLDTALKRLVYDSLLTLVRIDPKVAERLESFARDHLSNGSVAVDPEALVKVLMADGATPREVLVSTWAAELTRGSLQSRQQVEKICTALGVTASGFRKRIGSEGSVLEKAFRARNQIVHELDLPAHAAPTSDRDATDRRRRRRYAQSTIDLAVELLSVAQLVIDDVAARVSVAR